MMFDFLSLLNTGAVNPALNRLMQPFANGQPDQMQRQAPPLPPPVEVGPAPSVAGPQPDPMQTASVVPGSMAPTMPQPPAMPAPQQKSGGLLDGFNDFTNSDKGRALNDFFLGMAMGKSPQESLSLGSVMVAQNSRDRRNQNETVGWLQKRGLDADTAKMLASSPKSLQEYLTQTLVPQNGKENLIGAGGSIYNTKTGEWLTPPAGAGRQTEYGLNLIYGKDANGKTVAFQLSKDGTAKPFNPGNGVELTPGISQIDTGTGTLIVDNKTGQKVGEVTKDVSGAASQRKVGEAAGEAQSALPAAELAASTISKQIQELKDDPYLPNMLGWHSKLPNMTTDAARVQGKMNQLQGGAFLQARQMLKGGGAITDFEGAKAEDAYARLQTAQSLEDYKSALDDFNEATQVGLRKLQRQASLTGGGSSPAAPAAPAPSATGGTIRKYNPATGRIE